jgi:hypothetical protein
MEYRSGDHQHALGGFVAHGLPFQVQVPPTCIRLAAIPFG